MLVPVIAILTEHQRKMARILRGDADDVEALRAENDALRAELAEIKGIPLEPPASRPLVVGLHIGSGSKHSRRH